MFESSGSFALLVRPEWDGYAYLHAVQEKYWSVMAQKCGAVPTHEVFKENVGERFVEGGRELLLFARDREGVFRAVEVIEEGVWSYDMVDDIFEASRVHGLGTLRAVLSVFFEQDFVQKGFRKFSELPEVVLRGLLVRGGSIELFVIHGGAAGNAISFQNMPGASIVTVEDILVGPLSAVSFDGIQQQVGDAEETRLQLVVDALAVAAEERLGGPQYREDGADVASLLAMMFEGELAKGDVDVACALSSVLLNAMQRVISGGGRTWSKAGVGAKPVLDLQCLGGYCYLALFPRERWGVVAICFGASPPMPAVYDLYRKWADKGQIPFVRCLQFETYPPPLCKRVVHLVPTGRHVSGFELDGVRNGVGVVGVGGSPLLASILQCVQKAGGDAADVEALQGCEGTFEVVRRTAAMHDSDGKRMLAMFEARGDAFLTYGLAVKTGARCMTVQQYQEERSTKLSNTALAKVLLQIFSKDSFVYPTGVDLSTGKVGGKVFESIVGAIDAKAGFRVATLFCEGAGVYA